jgi:hypothetical protein
MTDWNINNIRVVTQTFDSNHDNLIARLSPVGGGTVHHFFGYDDPIIAMQGYIVGSGDAMALEALAQSETAYNVTGLLGNMGAYYVKNVQVKPQLGIYRQTFLVDGSHADTDPVYIVELELYKNV